VHKLEHVVVKRLDKAKGRLEQGFPEVITRLSEADIQAKGVRAWILQGEKHQLVFFEMESSAQVPEHSHEYAQWGIVIEGKMELIIEGKARICEKGDEYVIPARAKHYARFFTKSRVIDFFSERNRYRPKPAR
jgi:quercetin dioxygenase-like cupin family protein